MKDDAGKPRMDLIPPEAVFAMASVITTGADEYGERNWEKGMSWGRMFGAMMRHAWAWWRGEEFDPKSGHPHSWHMLTCAAMLVTYENRGMTDWDSRYKPMKFSGEPNQRSTTP